MRPIGYPELDKSKPKPAEMNGGLNILSDAVNL